MNFEINLTQIIVAVIALIFSVITGYLIPWIKSNTSEHTYKMIEMACASAVYFAQQWYKQEDGEKKKEEAIKYAENWLKEGGWREKEGRSDQVCGKLAERAQHQGRYAFGCGCYRG